MSLCANGVLRSISLPLLTLLYRKYFANQSISHRGLEAEARRDRCFQTLPNETPSRSSSGIRVHLFALKLISSTRASDSTARRGPASMGSRARPKFSDFLQRQRCEVEIRPVDGFQTTLMTKESTMQACERAKLSRRAFGAPPGARVSHALQSQNHSFSPPHLQPSNSTSKVRFLHSARGCPFRRLPFMSANVRLEREKGAPNLGDEGKKTKRSL